jgi:hypothetical protein
MRPLLWILLPDEALVLLLGLAGLLLMLGFRRAAGSIVGTVLLISFFGPSIEGFISELPPGLALAILAVVGWMILHACAPGLAHGVTRGLARLLCSAAMLPFRLAWSALFPRRFS